MRLEAKLMMYETACSSIGKGKTYQERLGRFYVVVERHRIPPPFRPGNLHRIFFAKWLWDYPAERAFLTLLYAYVKSANVRYMPVLRE